MASSAITLQQFRKGLNSKRIFVKMSTMTESTSSFSSTRTSLTPSKRVSSEVAKVYKHASQLYLTRRLVEAYELLQPLIKPANQSNGHAHSDDDALPQAPITTASTSQRIKIWSLYITLLNAIIDLGLEEGGSDFGPKEYRAIVKTVRDGEIWEQVVRDGYRGRESSVDGEVVYNLATLLLGQAASQELNQSRLETYLSSSSPPELDVSSHINRSPSRRSRSNGTDTPKDLTSRLRILELFTLHVLPRNEEWDYAKSFISNSDILDDDRREAFMTTLQELQEAKDHESLIEDEDDDYQQEHNEELQHQQQAASKKEAEHAVANGMSSEHLPHGHRRSNSEVDYGIEKSNPIGTATSMTSANGTTPLPTPPPSSSSVTKAKSPPPPSRSNPRSQLSPPVQVPKDRRVRKGSAAKSNDMLSQARNLFRALQNLAINMAGALTKNPTVLFRMILFVLAFIVAFSRREIRERAKRIVGSSWEKVRGTVGMGVKVSYI